MAFGGNRTGGTQGTPYAGGAGVRTSTSLSGMQPYTGRQAAPKPAPKPKAVSFTQTGAPSAPPVAPPPAVLTPAPVAPPSPAPSMAGLQGAASSPMDALNGPTSGPLRHDLGYRQHPSLAALLQGLRY